MSTRGFTVYGEFQGFWLQLVAVSVGNTPYETTVTDLKQYFSGAGNVTHVKIVHDRQTRRPRGFAFVEFSDEAGALKAVEQLNGVDFNGRPLRVNLANARC